MSHLVIFGERPGPNTDCTRPLYPHTKTGAAARLMRLLEMTEAEYLQTTRYNVVNDAETQTKNLAVRSRVRQLLEFHRNVARICKRSHARFIVLGRSTAAAFPPQYRYRPFGYPLGDVLLIPHTSGVNRYYNSQDNIDFIRQSLRDFLGRS